jgi:hypothetical protein
MRNDKRLKPPFVIKPGLKKDVYSFPKDYCSLRTYDKLVKENAQKVSEAERFELEDEMMWAKYGGRHE